MNKFPHAMLREIYEQPEAIGRTLGLYLDARGLNGAAFAPVANWLNARGGWNRWRQSAPRPAH
jgi:glucosamine--fructose-6-phosphate aminotransferase (isomerizing)